MRASLTRRMVAPLAVLAFASLAGMVGKAIGLGPVPLLARLMVVAALVLQRSQVCDTEADQWLHRENAWQMAASSLSTDLGLRSVSAPAKASALAWKLGHHRLELLVQSTDAPQSMCLDAEMAHLVGVAREVVERAVLLLKERAQLQRRAGESFLCLRVVQGSRVAPRPEKALPLACVG